MLTRDAYRTRMMVFLKRTTKRKREEEWKIVV